MPDILTRTGGTEGGGDVAGLVLDGEARLCPGAAAAAEGARSAGDVKDASHLAGQDLRLVVAAAELPRPVERHWDDEVHVLKMSGFRKLEAQYCGKPPPCTYIIIIFKRLRNFVVRRTGLIDKEGGRIGVVFSRSLYAGVEAVCQWVVGLLPDICQRKTCGAGDAKVILRDAQRAVADKAVSWKKKVL